MDINIVKIEGDVIDLFYVLVFILFKKIYFVIYVDVYDVDLVVIIVGVL